MRFAVAVLLLATPSVAQFVSIGELGGDATLAKVRVPKVVADGTSVYGAAPDDRTGLAFANYVRALQASDAPRAKQAWQALRKGKDWRARLAKHLRAAWPYSGWAEGKTDNAHALLDAVTIVGGDRFNRVFASRRKEYLKGCTKEIPETFTFTDHPMDISRAAVEALRGCDLMGSSQQMIGEPRNHMPGGNTLAVTTLRRWRAALPTLAIASSDRRLAGHVRQFQVGRRVNVSHLAQALMHGF